MTFREHRIDRDDGSAAQPDRDDDAREEEARLYCAACGHEVTRPAWALRLDGRHRHHCVNPMGVAFAVRLFGDAPGARAAGPASRRATWFAGYAWRLAACAGCKTHLGWVYEGAATPKVFYGLIADALTETPR